MDGWSKNSLAYKDLKITFLAYYIIWNSDNESGNKYGVIVWNLFINTHRNAHTIISIIIQDFSEALYMIIWTSQR